MHQHDITGPPPASPTTHHLSPMSSVWPMVVAAGLTLALFGLVIATPAFIVVGAVVLVAGVVGWVRELVAGDDPHEQEEHAHERA